MNRRHNGGVLETRRKGAFVVMGIAALTLAAILFGCSNQCESGAICGDYNTFMASALPSPSPTVLPGATPDPCRVEGVDVGFHSGAQLPFLALGASEQLDATPVNSSGEVAKGCNVTRQPTWAVLTPTTCQVIGSGYNPFLRGLRVGSCIVTATVASVVSAPFSVEVR